jgi:CubicO group peptidase (beta-lactamase class C family)
MAAALDGWAAQQALSGAVFVARGGDVLLTRAYGDADRTRQVANTLQTRFRIASLTKAFTAVSILQLQAQGKLDVQDPVCRYIRPCPPAWGAITLHELLDHTSGIPDYTNFTDFGAAQNSSATLAGLLARFQGQPLDFSPGMQWRYSNSGYIVLGLVVEKASGESYEQYLQRHIFTPLGMRDTGIDRGGSRVAAGYADDRLAADPMNMSVLFSAGGLYSTAGDLARWSQALDGDALLPAAERDLLFSPAVSVPDDTGRSYGYGWFLGALDGHPYQAHGGNAAGFSASLVRFPQDGVLVIVLSNQANVDASGISFDLGKLMLGLNSP